MRYSRGCAFVHQASGIEAIQLERFEQLVGAVINDGVGQGFPSRGNGLVSPGAPTGRHEKVFHRGPADDGADVVGHVANPGPLAHQPQAAEDREQFDQCAKVIVVGFQASTLGI